MQALKGRLAGAEESLERLALILQKIDNRSNEIGIFIFNCFALIDITIVRLFQQWQRTYEERTDEWIETRTSFDTLVSMGNYKLNENKAVQAEVVAENQVGL